VQVGHSIAQTGDVDFVGRDQHSQAPLKLEHHAHQVISIGLGQIGGFRDMRSPDHAKKNRMLRLVSRNDSQPVVACQQFAARPIA
jgi:hypothetical protein